MWYQCLLTHPLAIDNRTRTTDRAETAVSAVLVPCKREPPDGGGVQGGGGPRAALRGGQRAGLRVGQGAQTQATLSNS